MAEKTTLTNSQNLKSPDPEQLSALVDGEIDSDIDSLLNAASCDKECRSAWHRYHLVRDVLQRDYCSALPASVAVNISRQIAMEDDSLDTGDSNVVAFAARPETIKETQHRSHARQWLPMGLAASVAVAGFMAWQINGSRPANIASPINSVSIETGDSLVLADAAIPSSQSGVGTRWLVATAAPAPRNQQVEKRLNSLLINHLEDSTMGRVQGMLAHSRVVSYDSVPNESF